MDIYFCGVVALFLFGPLLFLHSSLANTPKVDAKEKGDIRVRDSAGELVSSTAVVVAAAIAFGAHFLEFVVLQWVFLTVLIVLVLLALLQKWTGAADDQSILAITAILGQHRHTNFTEFLEKHQTYVLEGKNTGNYVPGVVNYYCLMSDIITISSGPFWHFVPMTKGKSRKQCHHQFHHTTCEFLDTKSSDSILEVGCGFGEIGRQVAKISGAKVTGLTMAEEEIEGGNQRIKVHGLEKQCNMVQGNYHDMTMFADCSFDKVFGIYTLKYSSDLETAIKEMARVLKPGGRFLSYEIITTDKYDKTNKEHFRMVDTISTSTCMPPLWAAQDFRDAAKKAGLVLKEETDLCAPANEDPWYSCFEKTGVYYALASDTLSKLAVFAEKGLHILPKGCGKFYEQHLRHPLVDFVDAGRLGIINGALMMVWEKPL